MKILQRGVTFGKRARFIAPTGRFEVGESSSAAAARQAEHPMSRERVIELATTMIRDTHEIHVQLEDAQDDRALQRGRVNMLFKDRQFHRHTAMLLESEARHAREAWSHSMNYSKEIQTYDTRIGSLETLVATLLAQTSSLQTQLTAAHGRIQTLEARDPEPQDGPADAGSSFQGVANALAEIEANITSRNGDDSHDPGNGGRRQWFEKMKSVFHISNCTVACQIKFATCTLLGIALTWWNSHVKTIGHDSAYGMPWKTLKKMMTAKYCLRGKINKLDIKLWNMKVKESDEVEKYVSGIPDMIQGSVMTSKPKTIQNAIKFATELMDQNIRTLADRQAENKRKLDDTSRNNKNQQ
ncbi:hypothetical protein Tco_0737973 [Tanacetum coccineum]